LPAAVLDVLPFNRGAGEVEIIQIPSDSADAGLLGIVRAIPSASLIRI
jgi:hypothetical protein